MKKNRLTSEILKYRFEQNKTSKQRNEKGNAIACLIIVTLENKIKAHISRK